tara:strand:+ start:2403 stop:2519 length:117 start_codon:yes stop_codon:yes gene_type:complete
LEVTEKQKFRNSPGAEMPAGKSIWDGRPSSRKGVVSPS